MKNNRLITFLFYFFLIVCIVFLILDFMSIIKIDNAIKGGIIKQEEDKILCLNVYDKSKSLLLIIFFPSFPIKHNKHNYH